MVLLVLLLYSWERCWIVQHQLRCGRRNSGFEDWVESSGTLKRTVSAKPQMMNGTLWGCANNFSAGAHPIQLYSDGMFGVHEKKTNGSRGDTVVFKNWSQPILPVRNRQGVTS